MKKKLLSILMCAAMVASLAACGSSSSSSDDTTTSDDTSAAVEADATDDAADTTEYAETPDITLTYAEVNPEDTIVGALASNFASQVYELSKGTIYIDVQYSGVLGSESDVLDSMMVDSSTIQIARISAFALTNYGGEKSVLLSLPYTFESREHFWNFAMSDLAEEFLAESVENSGVRGLFYGEEGFRHFFTVSEVSGIEDFAGMQIRVSNDPIMNGLCESIGASPTVVSFSELYSALQTGVVDGAEQPIANYYSNAFQEVAPTLILDGHTLGAVEIIICEDVWQSLTTEQQEILTAAGEYAQAINQASSEEKEQEVLETLAAEGVNIVEVDDISVWQDAVADLVAEYIVGYEDLYQQILDFAN